MITHPRIHKPAAFWRKYRHAIWALAYCALIAYGSLFPFSDWHWPHRIPFLFLFQSWPHYITRTDILTNILVYIPLGFLLSKATRGMFLIPVLYGTLLSLMMEMLQAFVPGRVSSSLDLLTNGAGTLLGAVLAWWLAKQCWPWESLTIWRNKWFLPGRATDRGLMLLGLWALSQLSLQLPSLVAGNLHAGFTPFWETWADLSRFGLGQALIYCLEITGLGLFTAIIIKPGYRMMVLLFALLFGAIALKFLAAAILIKLSALVRLLSLEALTGLVAGLLIVGLVVSTHRLRRPYLAAIIALLGFALVKYMQDAAQGARGFPWLDLPSSMFNVTGLAQLFSDLWPFLAMGFLATHWIPSVTRTRQEKPAKKRRVPGEIG